MAISNVTGTVFLLFLSPFLLRAAWIAISRSQSRKIPSSTDYSRLPQFANYDVGEGFLLDVKEGNSIEFTVEAALTKSHPLHPSITVISLLAFAISSVTFTVPGGPSRTSTVRLSFRNP